MRRLALLVALGVAVLATAAIAGGAVRAAAGPEGVKITPLAHGTLAKTHAKGQGIDIRTNGVKDMLVTAIHGRTRRRQLRLAHASRARCSSP